MLIPLRELVSLIATKAGTADEEAAGMLSDLIFTNPHWMPVAMYEWQPSFGCHRILEGGQRMADVNAILQKWGRSELSRASLQGMADGRPCLILDRVGFRRSEVLPLVEEIDELSSEAPAVPTLGSWPEWKYWLAGLECITDKEAAAALAGVDLPQLDTYYPEEREECLSLRELIRRSCEGGSLPAKIVQVSDDGNQEWIIKSGDFARWCDSKGIPYPLPGRDYMEQPGAELKATTAPKEEIRRLRDSLQAKEEALVVVTAERDRLKTDFLERKSRTTALRVIGGLILANYKIDIHSDRLNGIQAIQGDLDTVGCSVDPKTLRELIKEAATVVPPSGSTVGK